MLRQTLTQVQPAEQMGIGDGTSLGLGIATVAGLLMDPPTPQKAIVFLTDGTGTDDTVVPLVVAEAAAQFDIQIFAIGIGQKGLVPFPQKGLAGGYEVYWESPLDEIVLHEMQDLTNGACFRVENGRSLQQITTTLSTPPQSGWEPSAQVRIQELFAGLLWSGVFTLLLEMWLRRFVLRVAV